MSLDIAIDLGTSKTIIYANGRIVLEQPTVVTVDSETFEPKFFGKDAKSTLGRTPDTLSCIFPIEHGAIADYDTTEAMLSKYMIDVFGNKIIRR